MCDPIILIPLSYIISDVLSCKKLKIARCDVNHHDFLDIISLLFCAVIASA